MSLENLCTFLLVKEKTRKHTFNIKSKLSQNCTEKQIMPLKETVNWPFTDKWYYWVIAFLNWKIGIFQQTVAGVYCILKPTIGLCTRRIWPTFKRRKWRKKISQGSLKDICCVTEYKSLHGQKIKLIIQTAIERTPKIWQNPR